MRPLFRFGASLVRHPGKLIQAIEFRAALLGTRYLHVVLADRRRWLAANSKASPCTTRARPGASPATTWPAASDSSPTSNCPLLLGCRLGETGVQVDDYQETTVPGVYCAGEVTGIGGLDLSLVEGEIAGLRRRRQTRSRSSPLRRARIAPSLRRRARTRLRPARRTPEPAAGRYHRLPLRGRHLRAHPPCAMAGAMPNCKPAAAWDRARAASAAARSSFCLGWKAESIRPPVFPARIESLSGPKYPQP